MMRFTGTLCAALGLTVAPGLLAADAESRDALERALAETRKAIEVVTGLEERLQRGDEEAVPLVLAVTEAPDDDARARDERIDALRVELALLQAQLDTYKGARFAEQSGGATWESLPPRGAGVPAITSGLDPTSRAALDESAGAADAPAPSAGSPDAGHAPSPAPSPAAALRAARASYRAEEHRRAIELLEPLGKVPEALYWRARSHERLDELEQAEALYLEVLEAEDGGTVVERASTDLEFLRWRMKFQHASGGRGAGS
jgi:hypothetical protein